MNQLKQIHFMKKILLLLSTIFLLNGCAESLALLGPGEHQTEELFNPV